MQPTSILQSVLGPETTKISVLHIYIHTSLKENMVQVMQVMQSVVFIEQYS